MAGQWRRVCASQGQNGLKTMESVEAEYVDKASRVSGNSWL